MMSDIDYFRIYQDLKEEFIDFKSESKLYEDALEAEIQEREQENDKLQSKLEHLETEYKSILKKYERESSEVIRLMTENEILRKRLKSYEEQKRDLEVLNDQWEQSARILEYSKQELEERLYQAEENVILYKGEIEELSSKKNEEMRRLTDQFNELKQELTIIETEKLEKNLKPRPEIVQNGQIYIKPINRCSSGPVSRNTSVGHSRKNSQEINDCSQVVKVIIRVRPALNGETWDRLNFLISNGRITIRENKPKAEPRTFEFDNIVTPEQDEDHMFKQINDCVSAVKNGKNACVLAYGQTGSGKTFTMNSMIAKAIDQISSMQNIEVAVQCIEVYNEQVINLGNPDSPIKNKEPLDVGEIRLGRNWAEKVLGVIKESMVRRTTKSTDCNERSSRSHAVYSIIIYSPDFSCKIQFVDLAGSERIGKSNVTGDMLKEALLINKSLSALQDVITALESKQKHVPYRNSVLTKLLQSTLGGSQSVVAMIVNCSPSSESLNESICTLNLASRVKAVDLGYYIRKNLKTQEVERTLVLLEKERSEKNSLLRTLDKLQRDLESYQYAVKDRDNKVSVLNNRLREKEKSLGAKKGYGMRKGKDEIVRDLIHLTVKDIGRVVSHSPTINFIGSPFSKDKPTRIPTPSCVNLKFGKYKLK